MVASQICTGCPFNTVCPAVFDETGKCGIIAVEQIVKRFTRGHLPAETIHDLSQDAFQALASKTELPSRLTPLVNGIVKNKVLEYWRNKLHRKRNFEEQYRPNWIAQHRPHAREREASDLMVDVESVINALGIEHPQWVIVITLLFEEWSQKDIAKVLGISLRTLQNHVHDIRMVLAAKFGAYLQHGHTYPNQPEK